MNAFFTTGNIENLGSDVNGVKVVDYLLCKQVTGDDYTGVSSWDEIEAWGEFRKYMIADFINEIAGGKNTIPAYTLIKGADGGYKMLSNSLFHENGDPIEFASITRRPNILPDKWNDSKTDNIDGIIYQIDGTSVKYVRNCVEMAVWGNL